MKFPRKIIAIILSAFSLTGSFSMVQANAVSDDDIIKTILDNRSVWNLKKSNNDDYNYSYVLLLDLNFDGKPEFISSENAPLSHHLYKFYDLDLNNKNLNKMSELMMSANLNNVEFSSYSHSNERFYTVKSLVNNPPQTRYFTNKITFGKEIFINPLFQKYIFTNDLSQYDSWLYYDIDKENLVNTTESDYNRRYEEYFSDLTNLNLRYRIVEIKYTDSYDTAYEKLKQSLDNFSVDLYLNGDANQDGIVNINDVTYLQMHIAGNKNTDGSAFIDETNKQLFDCVDMNKDGKLSVADVTALQIHISQNN